MVSDQLRGPHRLQQHRRPAAVPRRPQARGAGLPELSSQSRPPPLREAVSANADTCSPWRSRASRRSITSRSGGFLLNAQPHRLVLLKQLTRELAAQEVAVWKKVIRVIAHELNNSLAPITSLAHSGRLLARDAGARRTRRSWSASSRPSASGRRTWLPSSTAMRASPSCPARGRRRSSWAEFLAPARRRDDVSESRARCPSAQAQLRRRSAGAGDDQPAEERRGVRLSARMTSP